MVQAHRTRAGRPATSAARGRIGRQVAGTESVEIKATILGKNIRTSLKHLGLSPEKAEQRFVHFFDTPALALFRAGVIVRARRVPGHEHDSTIKIRPVRADQVPAKWHKDKGFKLEADAGETTIVRSASLTRTIGKGLIKRVVAGGEQLPAIFDKSQELFLAEMCRIRYDLGKLVLLGSISAFWWKIAHPGLPIPMTAELWTREDGETMLEASVRVPVEQAAYANAGFLAFLSELGAERDNAQQAKTRWALEFYAQRLGNGTKKSKPPLAAKGKKVAKPKDIYKKKPATGRPRPAVAKSAPQSAPVVKSQSKAKTVTTAAKKRPPPGSGRVTADVPAPGTLTVQTPAPPGATSPLARE